MAEARLTAEEAQALRLALAPMVIRRRTGELGIMHGADRFVGTRWILKKPDREALDDAARKVGLEGIREYLG